MRNKNLIGKKFGKLAPVSYDSGYWQCLCDCGNKSIVLTSHLISGNSKSCGCSKKENKSIEIKEKISNSLKQYDSRTASARRIWKSYGYNGDDECTLSFDKFYSLSQMNCNYCDNKPSNNFNYKNRLCGDFIYNGMDRIDSSLPHTDENCVPSCFICNRAKNNRTLIDFYNYINKLQINQVTQYPLLSLPENKYILTSMKTVYRIYKDDDLSLEDFYSISQFPCFYCGIEKSNTTNYAKTDKKSSQKAIEQADFKYNGIDRVDSSLPHSKNNIVPCCKYCNFAKSKLSIESFQQWIKRIKEHTEKSAVPLL